MIQVRNLTKIYGDGDTKLYALNRVSFDIKPGEFVALMG
jgi:putative ABC transport system ATP-binding protein